MGITVLGDVKTIVEDNHGEMYFDNAKKIVNGVEQDQHPATQHALQAKDVELVEELIEKPHQSIIQPDSNNQQILDLLFRADDDDHERTQILLSALIKGKKVKSKIVAQLYEHRNFFNLQNLSLEDKTKVINAWVEKLGFSEQLNGKKFTIKDW